MKVKTKSKIISIFLSSIIMLTFITTSAQATTNSVNNSSQIKTNIVKYGDSKIVELTQKNKKYYVTIKEETANVSTYSIINDSEVFKLHPEISTRYKIQNSINPLSSNIKVKRTYFSVSNSISDAKKDVDATTLSNQDLIHPDSTGYFLHGSYIDDYFSWLGHGYHTHISSRDANYISNMGALSGGTIAGALGAASIISAGTAVILGFILAAAVYTLYWIEQNDDGSLDIWSPDALRPTPSSYGGIRYGSPLGTAKIGSHWYPLYAN